MCHMQKTQHLISSNAKIQQQQKKCAILGIIHSLQNYTKSAHKTFMKIYRSGRHIIKQAETNTLPENTSMLSHMCRSQSIVCTCRNTGICISLCHIPYMCVCVCVYPINTYTKLYNLHIMLQYIVQYKDCEQIKTRS